MVDRGIGFSEIDEIVGNLKVVNEYEKDNPYPSCLALGFTRAVRPLHVMKTSQGEINEVSNLQKRHYVAG